MKIGVFDSGIGGLSVAKAIARAFPAAEVIYSNDVENVPYGTKEADYIYKLAYPKIKKLYEQGCDPIVLACNTLTVTNMPRFEAAFPVRFIGLDPMVNVAATGTKTNIIIVCATPTTLTSERYLQLKQASTAGITVIEPDCSGWASLIESNELTEEKIRAGIEPGVSAGADMIVLACTHYHWIEQSIKKIANGTATVLQPEKMVIQCIQELYS